MLYGKINPKGIGNLMKQQKIIRSYVAKVAVATISVEQAQYLLMEQNIFISLADIEDSAKQYNKELQELEARKALKELGLTPEDLAF